jgi:hypothetical protein
MALKELVAFKILDMKYMILIVFTFYSSLLLGQTNLTDNIKVQDSSFTSFLESRIINGYHSRLENVGEWGVCWIKFTLSANNTVSDIAISPNTNLVFANFLKEVITNTSGKWAFSNDFPLKQEKVIIIPVWYNLQKDGKAKKIENSDDHIVSFLTDSKKPNMVILFPKVEVVSPFRFSSGNNSGK